MGNLRGRTAIVTGGSRGIGSAIARRLGDEGANIAITYARSAEAAEDTVEAVRRSGAEAIAIQADSACAIQINDAVDRVAQTFGTIDILVNNAAVLHPGTVFDYDLDTLDEMIAVNIRGLFVATQASLRHIGEGGRIINIGSVSSDHMPFQGESVYSMTKGAVASLTRGLSRDLGPRGITVNNVQPGRVATDMIRSALGELGDDIRKTIAVQRFGTVDEVASLVAFLAGPDSAYITGASLKVDGGTTA